jgi:hypothetical protein
VQVRGRIKVSASQYKTTKDAWSRILCASGAWLLVRVVPGKKEVQGGSLVLHSKRRKRGSVPWQERKRYMRKTNQKVTKVNKRGMYTSPEIQARVRAKHVLGYRKSAIARQEHLCFRTVKKILTDEAAAELVAQAKRDFAALAEISVGVLAYHLRQNMDLNLAVNILRSLGIMTTAKDRALAVWGAQPLQSTRVNNEAPLGPLGMALLKQLELSDETFNPGVRRQLVGQA